MVMAYGQAITQGPDGQMYTDRSMQTPYNPPQQMPKMEQHIARPINDNMRMDIRDRMARPPEEILPVQDMRARPPGERLPPQNLRPIRPGGNQGGIGSFQNPFGGFMGGGRGQFMQPQPPMYGGGFGGFGGYGMQPPMYGGGFGGFGMPPMYGGGMYGGGFGMQPPMFGGFGGFGMQPPMYGGGFNPFSQNFYGGIGSMFPGMGGGYGMQRHPLFDYSGNNNIQPQSAQPIRPMFEPRELRERNLQAIPFSPDDQMIYPF